jgi:hypothetical protein
MENQKDSPDCITFNKSCDGVKVLNKYTTSSPGAFSRTILKIIQHLPIIISSSNNIIAKTVYAYY